MRTGVRYWAHGLPEPTGAVGRAGAAAVQRPLAGRAHVERRRRQPGVVAQAPALRARRRAPGAARCPTPSCTATPTSASSTAPPTPRSWPRRRPASAWRPWPSPTTTASTAWCASPRRPGRSGCPRCSAPSCTPRRGASAEPSGSRQEPPPPIPAVTTCWCWPTVPQGYAGLARAISRGQMAGEKGAPRFTLDGVAEASSGRLVGAHRVPQGRGARRPGRADGPAAARRELHRLVEAVRPRPGGRRAVGPRRAARLGPQRRPGRAGGARPASTCVATNNAHYARPAAAPAAHRAGRGAGPPQPRRARPLAAGAASRPPALGRRAGPPLRPLPRRGGGGGRARPGVRLRPGPRRPRPAAVPVPDRATPR